MRATAGRDQADDDDGGASERHRLSRAAMVIVGIDGPALPKNARFPIRELDLAGLELLAELSSGAHALDQVVVDVAARCGSSAELLEKLVTDLVERGLLVAADHPAAPISPTETAVADPSAWDLGADQTFVLAVPTVFRIHDRTFEHRRHDGTLLLALSPSELIAASELATAREP